MSDSFLKLLKIVQEKKKIDVDRGSQSLSMAYFSGIRSELDEVLEEINSGRQCYLEDELGDVLWDYLNLLVSLEKENRISLSNVFDRSVKKYEERVNGVKNGVSWNEIKIKQKEALEIESIIESKEIKN